MIALAASAVLLGACAGSFEARQDHTSSVVTDSLPTWAGGEPVNAPPRPASPPAYPAVNAPVPPRALPALTAEEQKTAIDELIAARNRAVARAKAADRDEDIATDEGLALARGKYAGDSPPNNN